MDNMEHTNPPLAADVAVAAQETKIPQTGLSEWGVLFAQVRAELDFSKAEFARTSERDTARFASIDALLANRKRDREAITRLIKRTREHGKRISRLGKLVKRLRHDDRKLCLSFSDDN